VLKIDGFDPAIIGVVDNWLPEPRLVYDGNKILTLLIADGMSMDDAMDYCSFNISGAYMGEGTPLILWEYDEDDQYAD
jgi:hypothetical protein